MREIVNIQVGQAGNSIGAEFWEVIAKEHRLSPNGHFDEDKTLKEEVYALPDKAPTNDPTKQGARKAAEAAQAAAYDAERHKLIHRADVYFSEADNNRFVPRNIMVDLEPQVINRISASPWGGLFKPDNAIKGSNGAGNNWAKGHYTEGAEMLQGVLDVARKETELCDSVQGFQMVHSLGGGTGSGMGTLIMQKLREEYPDRMMVSYPVLPSPKVSDVIVEPYNAMLSLHHLVENADEVFVLDNEALYDISSRIDKTQTADDLKKSGHSSFGQLNALVSTVMAGITCSMRFPGQLNGDLRKLGVNLIPFPRLHFFQIGYAPLMPPKYAEYRKTSVGALCKSMFNRDNMLAATDPLSGRYLTASSVFRGKVSMAEVDVEMGQLQKRHSPNFVEWIPNNFYSCVCDVPPAHTSVAATFIGNTTAIKQVFQRISDQFTTMFNRQAFVHCYLGEGMELLEFSDAEANTTDLIREYQQYDAAVEEQHDDGDEDEEVYESEEEEAAAAGMEPAPPPGHSEEDYEVVPGQVPP